MLMNTIKTAKEAETKVINAMEDITRATKKVLMDYINDMYLTSFAQVIAYLGPESDEAKELLSCMDKKIRNKVISSSNGFSKSNPAVILEVEHILTTHSMNFTKEYNTIRENLYQTSQDFAKKIIKDFRETTPIFQEQLNESIFSFDDITLLTDSGMQKILQEIDQQDVAMALKGAAPEIQDKVFRNLSQSSASMLKEDMEYMGPVHLNDVEKCRTKILNLILQLEDKGEIIITKRHNQDDWVD